MFCLCRQPRLRRAGGPAFANGRRMWKCDQCGLHQLAPYPVSGNADVSLYAQEGYHAKISEQEYHGYFRVLYDYAFRAVLRPDSRILDFGAGSCHYQKFLRELGHAQVYSLEPNPHLADAARRRLGAINVVSSLAELPAEPFDLIFANQVLEHLFDPCAALHGELAQHLRPGGHFVFAVPNGASLNRLFLGEKWVGYSPEEHIWFFDEPSVRHLFGASEIYEVVSVQVKSALGTPHDRFVPRGLHKRIYYQTVMRVFEALGHGDQLIVMLRARERGDDRAIPR